jgi:fumarate reductase subunit D
MHDPTMRRNDFRARTHPAYWAFVVHRLTGLALTLFLPLHFYVLSRALEGDAALDGLLRWSDRPAVKVCAALLVTALAAHLVGGVRLLLVEFRGWDRDRHRSAIAVGAGLVAAFGLAIALDLFA